MMQPIASWRCVCISAALLLLGANAMAQKSPTAAKKAEWLRGTGEKLEIRVRGEILDAEGNAADDAKLKGKITNGEGKSSDLEVHRDANGFEVWVPVGKQQWFSLLLECSSSDGTRAVTERIGNDQLRQAAIDGVKAQLCPFNRTIEIKVLDKGAPVGGANVRVDAGMRTGLQAVTDKEGIARFGMHQGEYPTAITAWTKDHRIGGYVLGRTPARDEKAHSHVAELSAGRAQIFRFIKDDDMTPVEGIQFDIVVATPAPNFNFIGEIPKTSMKTDSKGEATFSWFPDWPDAQFSTYRIDQQWVKVGKETLLADGTIEVRVKKSQFVNRKRISGQVTSIDGNAGGLCVQLYSFGGEEGNRADRLYAFTDEKGRFYSDFLPGSVYCTFVNDLQLFSDMIDVLPYDPKSDKITEPKLSVAKGDPVEILVSEGPSKKPLANVYVSLFHHHEMTWSQNGKTRYGQTHHQWDVKTDENGIAKSYCYPGKELVTSVYLPDWNTESKTQTKAGQLTKFELNRPLHIKRKLTGQMTLPPELDARLEGAEISISALDRGFDEAVSVKADSAGKFTIETSASRFGILVQTADYKAIAITILDAAEIQGVFPLPLSATGQIEGRLLGENDAPLVDYNITASFALELESGEEEDPIYRSFTASAKPVKTDANGNYTIAGVPYRAITHLRAMSKDRNAGSIYIDDVFLETGEKRPITTTRTGAGAAKSSSLKDRYTASLRDAKLGGFHLLVVAFDPGAANEQFVEQHFYNYGEVREVGSFMHAYYRTKGPKRVAADDEFAKSMDWPAPGDKNVIAIALDGSGKELGRLDLSVADEAATEKAAKFIREFVPVKVNAKKKWDDAFDLATKTNRKVWVRVSQRFCGPCHILNRWLDDQKMLLEKDYVFLKIDDVLDEYGLEVTQRLTTVGDKRNHGVPFHAIFDASGTKLIDSAGPLGNIGAPSGYEGGKHLKKMLSTTRKKLTDEEIEKLVKSLAE